MRTIAAVLIALASLSHAFPDNNIKQGSPVTQASISKPIYAPSQEQPSYIPHATYPYADAYGQTSDYGGYAGSAALAAQYPYINDYTSLIPSTTGLFVTSLRLLAKVGLFLIGGIVFAIISGIFTTAICSLTPLCSITFAGIGQLNREAVRTFVTPERVAEAAAFVGKAVDKYQGMQESVINRK